MAQPLKYSQNDITDSPVQMGSRPHPQVRHVRRQIWTTLVRYGYAPAHDTRRKTGLLRRTGLDLRADGDRYVVVALTGARTSIRPGI
jgi:hypothetical protein